VISGINHLTFSVSDLPRSLAFYCGVLQLRLVARWPAGAYLVAGDLWVALVVDPAVRAAPLPEHTHAAFTVAPESFAAMAAAIRASGAAEWQQNWTEGDSVYFLDPDGHKLEVHASDLAGRLRAARARPWEGLELLDEPWSWR
jgi:catechol 2,3-dioxygenase-like lactoylglutathione lyase family enzyme